jgi:hypothetical protein
VKRKAVIILLSQDKRRAFAIDSEFYDEILEFVNQSPQYTKKFIHIVENVILKNHNIPDLYDKEEINAKTKGVTAMKFFKRGNNDRIYCKEISFEGTFVIVASRLFPKKKTQKNDNRINSILNEIGKYDYSTVEYNIVE